MKRRSSFFVRILLLAAVVFAAPGCGLERSGMTDGTSGDGRDADGTGPHVCGNDRTELPEECDDGNAIPGDGCEANCTFSCHDNSECDDGNQCTEDVCSYIAAGADCFNRVVTGMDCDDGNPCTYDDVTRRDSCQGDPPVCVSGPNHCQCSTAPDCIPFNPTNRCEGTLVCDGTVCIIDPTTIVVCDTSGDTDCRRNACNPGTGTCGMVDQPDRTFCNDGDWCSLTEDCRGGTCTELLPRCTQACEICNGGAANCDPAPGWCIIGSNCIAEGIKNPANPCQACQPLTDPWNYSNLSAGAACDDDSFCNGRETCNSAGSCLDGDDPCPAVGCVDGCNEGTDRCTPAGTSTLCRDTTGPCDPAENCDGSSMDCPADRLASPGDECRASRGDCDVAEVCDGSTVTCPADGARPGTFECRLSRGDCDPAETCGTSTTVCPADLTRPGSFECRPSRGACDPAETCGASTTTCPADVTGPSSFVCRTSTGACDPAETCGSSTSGCPADVLVADGAVCPGIPTGVCCTGTCHDPGNCCSDAQCTSILASDHCNTTTLRCVCGTSSNPCGGTDICCRGGSHDGDCRTPAQGC